MALKESILARLSAAAPDAVSGQTLAEENGVSRNAVWKAVNALRREGYAVSAAENRGYTLDAVPDRLDGAEIERLLGGADIDVRVMRSVDSTNSEVRRLLGSGTRPILVCAESQTAGRGRSGKSFLSPEGAGLYMSLGFRPGEDFSAAAGLTAYAAVAAARAAEHAAGVFCGIKWVNDLYVGDKKVCGVLTEAVTDLETGGLGAVIIGVGMNLRTAAIPEELRGIAAGLDCTEPVKNRLASEIASALLRFDSRDKGFMEEYRARSVVLGRRVSYLVSGARVTGTAMSIDSDGALHILRDTGAADILSSGEVSLEHIEGIK